MMSSSANYRPFLSSFRHIPPQGFCQVNCLDQQWPPTGKLFICSNLGQNPSAMGAGHLQEIKHLSWDQLLATKAEIIQS